MHELVGAWCATAPVRELGRVVAVEANPAHDLLVLDGGAWCRIVFVVEHDGDGVVDRPARRPPRH